MPQNEQSELQNFYSNQLLSFFDKNLPAVSDEDMKKSLGEALSKMERKETIGEMYDRVEKESAESVVNITKRLIAKKAAEPVPDVPSDPKTYFTPDIEDIRIGYECYISEKREDINKVWNKFKVESSQDFNTLWDLYNEGKLQTEVRTLYLRDDQIRAEGFELKKKSIDSWYQFKESPITHTEIQDYYGYKPYSLYMNYGFHDHKMKITCDFSGGADFGNSDTLFEGECKSINEFRQILKFLHIK